MSNIITDGIAITSIIATIAFTTSLIVEVTKRIKPISLMPTQLWCIIVSVVLCVVGYFAYCVYAGIPIIWYLAGDAVIAAFVIAYVAMYGWDILKALYDRYIRRK